MNQAKKLKLYNQYKLIYHFEIINIQIRDNCSFMNQIII